MSGVDLFILATVGAMILMGLMFSLFGNDGKSKKSTRSLTPHK